MTNITPLIGNISWRSNKDELGQELNFDIAYTDFRYYPKNPLLIGDVIVLKNKDEITRGIIVDEVRAGRNPVKYTVFDYAFYLNKSTAIYQFNSIAADQAITKILKDFNVPIGAIAKMPTKIKHIFNNENVADIIKEILAIVERSTGVKYLMEMRKGKLVIEKRGSLKVRGVFTLYPTGSPADSTLAVNSPSRRRSIQDMINTIQIVDNNDKLIATRADSANANKYGRLQKVITVDQEEKKYATRIAQNELNELSRVVEEVSVQLIGDDNVRAGRLFEITEETTGIKGTYLINDVEHSIANGIHTMNMNLGAI